MSSGCLNGAAILIENGSHVKGFLGGSSNKVAAEQPDMYGKSNERSMFIALPEGFQTRLVLPHGGRLA